MSHNLCFREANDGASHSYLRAFLGGNDPWRPHIFTYPGAGNISQRPLTAYPEDKWAHIFKLEGVSNQRVKVWWAQAETWASSVRQQWP